MQTKQILAIVAVVAMLGAAFVGIGYAYTASVENADNTAAPTYWKLTIDDASEAEAVADSSYATFTSGIKFDTTTADGVTYKYVMSQSDLVTFGDLKVSDLGYVTLGIKDQDGHKPTAVSAPKYYPLAVTLEDGKYSDQYNFFAATYVLSGETKTYGQLTMFVDGVANLLTNPVEDSVNDKLTLNVAIFAMPVGELTQIPKALDAAKITFAMESEAVDATTPLTAVGGDTPIQKETKTAYVVGETYVATGLVVPVTLSNTTFSQVIAVSSTGLTITSPSAALTATDADVIYKVNAIANLSAESAAVTLTGEISASSTVASISVPFAAIELAHSDADAQTVDTVKTAIIEAIGSQKITPVMDNGAVDSEVTVTPEMLSGAIPATQATAVQTPITVTITYEGATTTFLLTIAA